MCDANLAVRKFMAFDESVSAQVSHQSAGSGNARNCCLILVPVCVIVSLICLCAYLFPVLVFVVVLLPALIIPLLL